MNIFYFSHQTKHFSFLPLFLFSILSPSWLNQDKYTSGTRREESCAGETRTGALTGTHECEGCRAGFYREWLVRGNEGQVCR